LENQGQCRGKPKIIVSIRPYYSGCSAMQESKFMVLSKRNNSILLKEASATPEDKEEERQPVNRLFSLVFFGVFFLVREV
jgi:hypothetical protein